VAEFVTVRAELTVIGVVAVAVNPVASTTVARKVYAPAATLVQVNEYGAVVS
jgi:hypothetical protein